MLHYNLGHKQFHRFVLGCHESSVFYDVISGVYDVISESYDFIIVFKTL